MGKITTWKELTLRYRTFCILFLARPPLIQVHENINFQVRNKEIWSRKEKTLPYFLHILCWNQLWVTDSFHLCKRQQHFNFAQISVTWDVTAVLLSMGIKSSFLQNLKPGYGNSCSSLPVCMEKDWTVQQQGQKKPQMHHMETQQLILMWCYYFHRTIILHQCLLITPKVWTGLW